MAHRASAVVLGAFAVAHLLNHIWGLGGAGAPIAFMDVARGVYRSPFGEAILRPALPRRWFLGWA